MDPGKYIVTLTVADDEGFTNVTKIELDVLISVPEARILKPSGYEFNIGKMVNFKGEADYIGDFDNLEFEWQLGDGNFAIGSSTKHSYSATGTYSSNELQTFVMVKD